MGTKNKLIVLWLMLLIGMILHFNYHVSGIFYGIDVKNPNATGTVPPSLIIIRTLFYHLPFIFILLLFYFRQKWFSIFMFIVSVIYTLAHAVHAVKEVQKIDKDYSQVSLLLIVLVVAITLTIEHYNWIKNTSKTLTS